MTISKRFAAFLGAALAVLVLIGAVLGGSAFADNTGTITVSNAKSGQTYTVYRLLDLESYNTTDNAYAYKVDAAWKGFFEGTDVNGVYVNIDDQGYVTWKDSADQAAFAQLAAAYASTNKIANNGSQSATSTTVTFSGLPLGYYLMDSSMGALCSLDTTNPNVTLQEKNFEPTIEKKVNRGGEAYGDSNTAKLGDTITFRTVVSADAGSENFVVHDKMDAGLTFSGLVAEGSATSWGVNYRVSGDSSTETQLANGTDYQLIANPGDGCAFHIVFSDAFLKTITSKVYINIHYQATLNTNAVIGGTGNGNETWLKYGDDMTTTTDKTATYSYGFDLVKTTDTKKVLSGATFDLYTAKTGDSKINLIDLGNGVYRVATADEANAAGFTSATVTAGKATIKGLSNGTYYLEELQAPDGYNKLADRQAVNIADSDSIATLSDNDTVYVSGGVNVVNRTGKILPSTGDMGALIFYLVGGVLVIAAAAIMITSFRRRHSETGKHGAPLSK